MKHGSSSLLCGRGQGGHLGKATMLLANTQGWFQISKGQKRGLPVSKINWVDWPEGCRAKYINSWEKEFWDKLSRREPAAC
jgi:hypothetical protein